MAIRLAVASTDGKVVNEHFGRAVDFYIIEADETGISRMVEHRITEAVCQSGNHDEDAMKHKVDALKDCQCVLVSRIGMGAQQALEQAGITAFQLPGWIDEAVHKAVSYMMIQELLYGAS
jgi:predicted Fe-Mo cluster-binding NifX family protein